MGVRHGARRLSQRCRHSDHSIQLFFLFVKKYLSLHTDNLVPFMQSHVIRATTPYTVGIHELKKMAHHTESSSVVGDALGFEKVGERVGGGA